MSRYNKQADIRDQQAAAWILKDNNIYSEYTDTHLKNALRFARGCGGSESQARQKMILKELKKRNERVN